MIRLEGDPTIEIPKRVFGGRKDVPAHVPEILGWIDQNPILFTVLLESFDTVVEDFNTRTTADSSYQNFHIIKEILGDQPLPTTGQLISEKRVSAARAYMRTLGNIKEMMIRGQMPEGERVEPWVGYHTTQTNTKNLVIASIFHTYEELVKNRPEFKDKEFESDRIIEALMEVASEHPESGLFDALARKDGLNWVDNYSRFTPEFRRKNGYT